MKPVKFAGIDEWHRPVFTRKNSEGKKEYYCTVDYLLSWDEKPDLQAVKAEGLHWKGYDMEGEPHYIVSDVEPIL